MDQKFVKRNYLYFIYNILKNETRKNGKHFTAEDLIEKISKEYGIAPNRKTIYTVIDDLIQLGYDIKLKKDQPNRGYYLDHRKVKKSDFSLILDGLASLTNLGVDWKQDIIENLCKVLGYDYSKVDLYEYTTREKILDTSFYYPTKSLKVDEDEFYKDAKAVLDVIIEAIDDRKKIKIIDDDGFDLKEFLLEKPNKKFNDFLATINTKEFTVNPYHIFRSSDNILYFVYYIRTFTDTYVFATSIYRFYKIIETEYKMDKNDSKLLNLNLDDFVNPKLYRKKLIEQNETKTIKFTIDFGIHEDSELLKGAIDMLENYRIVTEDGIDYVAGTYKLAMEKELFGYVFKNINHLIVSPNNDIYKRLSYLANVLQKYKEIQS